MDTISDDEGIMILVILTLVLLIICGLIGWLGSKRKIGFLASFLLSLILCVLSLFFSAVATKNLSENIGLTLIVGFLLGSAISLITVLASKRKGEISEEQLQKKSATEKTNHLTIAEELQKLLKLKEDGTITENEYQLLKNKLIAKFD